MLQTKSWVAGKPEHAECCQPFKTYVSLFCPTAVKLSPQWQSKKFQKEDYLTSRVAKATVQV